MAGTSVSGTAAVRRSEPDPPAILSARIRFLAKSSVLLLRFPGTLVDLGRGWRPGVASMERRVIERYQRSPSGYARVGRARIRVNPFNTPAENGSMVVAHWYEPPVTEVFRTLCRRGGRVVDVGANVGWYTFLAADRVGPKGRVVAFEPEEENFQLLSQSLRENPRPQVEIARVSVSDHEGVEQLSLSEEAASFHSISRTVGPRSVTVPAVPLGRELERRGMVTADLLKVDVEGGEPKVLRGARPLWGGGLLPNVILEWRPQSWEGESPLWEEIVEFYDVFRIAFSPRLLVSIAEPTIERVSAATSRAGRHGADLYLRRKARGA